MLKKISASLLIFSSAFYISCATVDYRTVMKAPEEKFEKGEYLEAAKMLLPEVNKTGKDQLLFMMECGYILHAGADYQKSNMVLLPASKEAKVVPISITQQVAGLLTNQTATNYRGEDFEKVLIHMFLGINFLKLKDYDSARVEFKAVNDELAKVKQETGAAKYKQNLMAKYLTAVSYEIIGDANNDKNDLEFAYIEYKQIYQLSPGLGLVQTDLQRLSKKLNYMDEYQEWTAKFGKKDFMSDDSGEFILIYQAGKSPIKATRGKLLDDPTMNAGIMISLRTMTLAAGVTTAAVLATMKMAENPIPKFLRRSNHTAAMRISYTGGGQQTIILEDIENTVIRNFDDQYPDLSKKVAASIVTKAIVSVAAGVAGQQITKAAGGGKGLSSIIGLVAGLGTGAILFSTMRPDLRCWHTLPGNLQLGRVFLKPGKYDITLEYLGIGGNVMSSTTFPVDIKKGEKIFHNIRTLQ
jgi:hypothetical protein